ncbi:hypothetical protein B0J12DRAFT_462344 [Macrophomina phaseolina]|uniref:Uncharacterized protein n=1 Tax=Macrophomina phaseolina TaxID=35725 RepID=A0ABQ8FQC1_9PEZI|nr:hypothetical protein B0J12DRAFT_462344 [Macrophomina phaseolina]
MYILPFVFSTHILFLNLVSGPRFPNFLPPIARSPAEPRTIVLPLRRLEGNTVASPLSSSLRAVAAHAIVLFSPSSEGKSRLRDLSAGNGRVSTVYEVG